MNEPNQPTSVDGLMDLSGHRALITGASGNIGAAIARRLAMAGAEIVIHYNGNAAAARALEKELNAIGVRTGLVHANLSTADGARALFAGIDASGGVADLVVNNAANQDVQPLAGMALTDWQMVMAANLDSAFSVTQLAVERLLKSGRAGAIVNVASIEGFDPATGHAHYASSKAGMLMLTKAAALEYGSSGIRVNAVSPGLIDRDGLKADWPEGVASWLSKAPLGRLGTAEDVAVAVLYLLSPAARWISGANLIVDGGMSTVSRW
ncbi:MAG: SDR family oxidoreductase [Woeseiaceae bacterium]|nr:SDR family oxidoreductase [Woeseiaceae bacterium]